MQCQHALAHVGKQLAPCLEQAQQFALVADLPFPCVHGSDAGQHVDTRRELLAHQGVGNPAGDLVVGNRDQDDNEIGGRGGFERAFNHERNLQRSARRTKAGEGNRVTIRGVLLPPTQPTDGSPFHA